MCILISFFMTAVYKTVEIFLSWNHTMRDFHICFLTLMHCTLLGSLFEVLHKVITRS